jgi:hypothetical protein
MAEKEPWIEAVRLAAGGGFEPPTFRYEPDIIEFSR